MDAYMLKQHHEDNIKNIESAVMKYFSPIFLNFQDWKDGKFDSELKIKIVDIPNNILGVFEKVLDYNGYIIKRTTIIEYGIQYNERFEIKIEAISIKLPE